MSNRPTMREALKDLVDATSLVSVGRYDQEAHDIALSRARAALAEPEAQMPSEADELRDVLRRNGFVPCDIAACNCNSWHARYGLIERLAEIKEALAEAGHPLCNENGNLTINALKQLVQERDQLRQACADAAMAAAPQSVEPVADRLDALLGALRRLWPLFDKATKGYVFTADRAGEVTADMNTLRAAFSAPPRVKEEGS